MERIGIKYCGGCNPRIDRSGLVREMEKLLPPDYRLVANRSSSPWEIAVLVCGCEVACANQPTARCLARHWVHVGGETVDWELVSKDKMAGVIVGKIQRLRLEKEAFA